MIGAVARVMIHFTAFLTSTAIESLLPSSEPPAFTTDYEDALLLLQTRARVSVNGGSSVSTLDEHHLSPTGGPPWCIALVARLAARGDAELLEACAKRLPHVACRETLAKLGPRPWATAVRDEVCRAGEDHVQGTSLLAQAAWAVRQQDDLAVADEAMLEATLQRKGSDIATEPLPPFPKKNCRNMTLKTNNETNVSNVDYPNGTIDAGCWIKEDASNSAWTAPSSGQGGNQGQSGNTASNASNGDDSSGDANQSSNSSTDQEQSSNSTGDANQSAEALQVWHDGCLLKVKETLAAKWNTYCSWPISAYGKKSAACVEECNHCNFGAGPTSEETAVSGCALVQGYDCKVLDTDGADCDVPETAAVAEAHG